MKKLCIVGLGYVGLPLVLAFSEVSEYLVYGFDVSEKRVSELKSHYDSNGEHKLEEFSDDIVWTTNMIPAADYYFITVPTPVDRNYNPDLSYVINAGKGVGIVAPENSIIVLESTVAPGTTDNEFKEAVLSTSIHKNLRFAYSPERINPGDKINTLTSVVKVVGANDVETLKEISTVYREICKGGVHEVKSTKAAELCKIAENTLRDVNIAFMNEITFIANENGISVRDVQRAMETKWNYPGFSPGLVGGHCIGVDPYYLIKQSDDNNYDIPIIESARDFNEQLPYFYINKIMNKHKRKLNSHVRIAIYGVTFKPDIKDVRNSKVMNLIKAILIHTDKNSTITIFDFNIDIDQFKKEWKHSFNSEIPKNIIFAQGYALTDFDIKIFAVKHKEFSNMTLTDIEFGMNENGLIADLVDLNREIKNTRYNYWSL